MKFKFIIASVLLSLTACVKYEVGEDSKKDEYAKLRIYENTIVFYDKTNKMDDFLRSCGNENWSGITSLGISIVQASKTQPGKIVFSDLPTCLYTPISNDVFEVIVNTKKKPSEIGIRNFMVGGNDYVIMRYSGTLDWNGNGTMKIDYEIAGLMFFTSTARIKKYEPKSGGYQGNGFAPKSCE